MRLVPGTLSPREARATARAGVSGAEEAAQLATVGQGAAWTGGRLLAVAAAATLLAGCNAWRCDFESHGACVEFTSDPPDLADTKARVDALLDRELPFWGLSHLSGWRIQFRTTFDHPCYLAAQSEGCTDYLDKTISVRVKPSAGGCFEAAELLHELGHYELGDPMHSNAAWQGVEPAFAAMVWDFPGAPDECVARFKGITTGMWTVNIDGF
jgi:hypothetical protein